MSVIVNAPPRLKPAPVESTDCVVNLVTTDASPELARYVAEARDSQRRLSGR
jgi:hypothetical protein